MGYNGHRWSRPEPSRASRRQLPGRTMPGRVAPPTLRSRTPPKAGAGRRRSVSLSVTSDQSGGALWKIKSSSALFEVMSLSDLRAAALHAGAPKHKVAAALDSPQPKSAMLRLAKKSSGRGKSALADKFGYDKATRTCECPRVRWHRWYVCMRWG